MGLSLNLQLPTTDLIQKQANQQYLTLLNKTNFANFMGNQLTGLLSDKLNNAFGDSGIGRLIGNVFGNGLGSVGSTILDNYLKGNTLMQGIGKNLGASLQGAASGLVADFAGKGVNALMGDSKLGNFTGAATSSALGLILGGGIGNPITFGANVLGSGLSAAFGPSKEYGGKYGNITKTMDSIYGAVQGAAGLFGPVGAGVSAAMALNKGLSNLFGSTDGMTKQDAILGSAFMPAPVKWLNAGLGKKTGSFDNQSWLNQEKANSFMLNGFGDLGERFDLARNEANKKYGLFSQHARRKAQRNIDFANNAWDLVLAMADQNELQNIRSQYMSSINNQRYALMINGGFQPLAVGKRGMKILNNQTNHNMGLRLLSAAALIDNKAMILSALGGTKLTRLRPKPLPKKPATREENPELWDEWERREAERQAARLQVYDLERQAATQRAETNALHYSDLATGIAETVLQNALFEPVTQESLQNSNTERLRQELLDDKNEYFDRGMDFINAAGFADLGVNVAGPLLLRGFRWAFNKAGLLVRVPVLTSENVTLNFLKFVGGSGKPTTLVVPRTQAQKEMYLMLELSGVDMSKISIEDINKALELRLLLLFTSGKRFSFLEPVTHNTEMIRDIDNGLEVAYIGLRKPYLTNDKGFAEDAWILYSSNPRNKGLKVDMVENLSQTKSGFNKTYHGEQERLTNSAILLGKQQGYEGVVSGESLLSPEKTVKMYPKYKYKRILDWNGTYNWQNHNPGLPLLPGPVYMLEQPTYKTRIKSIIFDPKIIDSKGKMKINWKKGASMFTAYGVPITLGGYTYVNTQ